MPIHETTRVVTISGRRWKIGKFDALTGSYIALKMISKLSGIAVGVVSGEIKDESLIAMAVAQELGSLRKHEFSEIQHESLFVISEIKTVGDKELIQPVRLPDGNWGVEGIADDALLVMTLVSHVLLFNLSGFFDGNALKDSKESFQGLMPFNAKTSTTSPTDQ